MNWKTLQVLDLALTILLQRKRGMNIEEHYGPHSNVRGCGQRGVQIASGHGPKPRYQQGHCSCITYILTLGLTLLFARQK